MNLGFCTFASSSSGNSYLIKSDTTNLILDIGITLKKLKTDMEHLGLSLNDIDGILITHDHGDHIKGLKALMKKTSCPVYISRGTLDALSKRDAALPYERFITVEAGDICTIGDLEIVVSAASHDTEEPVCYQVKRNGYKVSVVTDTGYMPEEVYQNIKDSSILALEANHERNILLYGKYPYSLKMRILSAVGHLSNESCGDILKRMLEEQKCIKPKVCLAHLSRENNTPEQAYITVKNILEESGFYVGKDLELQVLSKDEMSELMTI